MNPPVIVSYSWWRCTRSASLARSLVERLRFIALQMPLEPVGKVVVLTGSEIQRLARRRGRAAGAGDGLPWPTQAVYFNATFPEGQPQPFGLPLYDRAGDEKRGGECWSWSGTFQTSDLRLSGSFMRDAAALGIEVTEEFCGTGFRHTWDAHAGVVRTDTFDPKGVPPAAGQ